MVSLVATFLKEDWQAVEDACTTYAPGWQKQSPVFAPDTVATTIGVPDQIPQNEKLELPRVSNVCPTICNVKRQRAAARRARATSGSSRHQTEDSKHRSSLAR